MAVDLAQGVAARQLAAQDAIALRRVFENLTATSCPQCYNFHMHTVCSDGRLQPEALIEQAVVLGLQGLAITDHHSVNGFRRAQQWLDQRSTVDPTAALPYLWSGMEVNAGLLNDEVHILAYAFDPNHEALAPYSRGTAAVGEDYWAERAIAAIHAAGGLAVLAHPARYRRSVADLIAEAARLGIDGVEAYYAYNNPSPWQPSPRQMQEVKSLGEAYGLLQTCGTDTHGLSLLQRL